MVFEHPSLKELQGDAEYRFWTTSACAVELARNLANTRGSEADPDYMENQVRKIVGEGNPHVKSFKVVKG